MTMELDILHTTQNVLLYILFHIGIYGYFEWKLRYYFALYFIMVGVGNL